MATLTQLRVRFREAMGFADQTDVDQGDPPQAVITKLINEARSRRYMSLVTSFPRKFLTKATMVYPAGMESVGLPGSAQGRMISMVTMQREAGTSDVVELLPKPLDELMDYGPNGYPEAYSVDIVGKSIWLRPMPSVDRELYLYYVAALPELSNSSDSPTESPSEFHHLYVYDAMSQYLREQGAPDHAKYTSFTDDIFNSLKIYVERNYQDTAARKRAQIL